MKKTAVYSFLFFALLVSVLPGAAQNVFAGSWTAGVGHNGASRRYDLTLRDGGSCVVRVSAPVNGRETAQETEGSWSYGDDIFKLNALFKNPALPGVQSIQWVSIAALSGDNNSFNILARPDSSSQDPVRITFFRENPSFIDDAVTQAYQALSKDIPERSRLAVVNITSNDQDEGGFLINELILLFVNARRFTVIERGDIDTVLREQNFQLSGFVDDDSAVSIGKLLGATVVITGSVNGSGARKRLVLKALDVQTAEILAMSQAAL
jgi:TolB-like protein